MKKKFLSTLLALCMALALLPGAALAAAPSGSCGRSVTWSYSNGTLTIQGTGPMEDYYYTDSYDVMQPWHDYREQIHTVRIGDGVTSIGAWAFWACGEMTGVSIPNSVTTIGNNAFDGGYSLTGVSIPGNVTAIGYSAFSGCERLTSVTIPASVTKIGDWAFAQCDSLTDVYYGGSESQWKQITIDNDHNFNDQLLNATIHFNSTGSGTTPTPGTSTPSPDASAANTDFIIENGVLTDYQGTDTVITIPSGVTAIGEFALSMKEGLVSVTIPEGVTVIEKGAFFWCGSLSSVTLPNSLATIEDAAFMNCESLTSLTIPNGVTRIEKFAFNGCKKLTGLTIPNSVASLGEFALSACDSLRSVSISNSVTSLENALFMGCGSLTSVSIPESVTTIMSTAFGGCDNLTSVTIPKSVTSIGLSAFAYCESLADVYYGGSAADWAAIEIDSTNDGNAELLRATIHYAGAGTTAPTPSAPSTPAASGPDEADMAKAYAKVLQDIVNRYGYCTAVPDREEDFRQPFENGLTNAHLGLAYADLIDFDANGTPELYLFYVAKGTSDGETTCIIHEELWNWNGSAALKVHEEEYVSARSYNE